MMQKNSEKNKTKKLISNNYSSTKKKNKHIRLKVLFIVSALFVSVYSVVTLIYQQIEISAKTDELEDIKNQILLQDVKNEEMKNVYEVLKDLNDEDNSDQDYGEGLNYIERVAREDYGYSKQGERVFVNISGD